MKTYTMCSCGTGLWIRLSALISMWEDNLAPRKHMIAESISEKASAAAHLQFHSNFRKVGRKIGIRTR